MARPARRTPAASGLSLLTPAEAAGRIGASEMHIYRLIADGELRAVDIAQRGSKRSKTRVRSDDIDQYIEARTRSTGDCDPRPAA
jgi:excisionase family DNA binding protein